MKEEKQRPMLVINLSSSECLNCGRGCSPEEKSHLTVLGYSVPKDEKGCGIEYKYVTSDYMGMKMEERCKEMRPDLIWIDTGRVPLENN